MKVGSWVFKKGKKRSRYGIIKCIENDTNGCFVKWYKIYRDNIRKTGFGLYYYTTSYEMKKDLIPFNCYFDVSTIGIFFG